MRKIYFLLLVCFSMPSYSQVIAQCSNPKGFGYYPFMGLVPEKSKDGLHAGWNDESITGGMTQLNKIDDNNYDILFVDATKKIISATADGGVVIKNSSGEDSASFVVIYPGKTIEIYTFLKNNNGEYEYTHVTSRSGNLVPIIKTSVMRGECRSIDFSELR